MLNGQKKLGPYVLLEEVGSGGLGKVFRAVDERTGKTVAVKILHERFTTSRKFLGIFHRELLTIARLHHKNIVSYLDSFFKPPLCYIVTEFVDGFSCYGLLKRVEKVPPLVALCMAMDVLQGLDHLHLHDTIHSDLSSPNIMVNRHGRVLVTDFGLACQLDVEDYKNYMIGTPGYYSPEHITEAAIVPQTDLYCVGLILFELITGQRAVIASADRHKVLAGMERIPIKLVSCNDKKMQVLIQKLLIRALQFNASRRTPSAEAMMYEIYIILKTYGIKYGRHAVLEYMTAQGLSSVKFKGKSQDIYRGAA